MEPSDVVNITCPTAGTAAACEQARRQFLQLTSDATTSCETNVANIAKTAAWALDVQRVGVWQLADQDQALHCKHLYERNSNQTSSGAVLRAEDFPVYFSALKSQLTIPINDAYTHPITKELLDDYLVPLGITSMLDVPIYDQGKVIGVVCCESTGPARQWSPEARAMVTAAATTISRLLADARILQVQDSLQRYEMHILKMRHMEAMGRAATNIAHDFSNVLSVITGFGTLIADESSTNQQLRDYAQHILSAAARGSAMCKELMNFGQATPGDAKINNVIPIIEALREILPVMLTSQITLSLQLAPVGLVLIDSVLLERTLLNLATNGRDAMPNGGKLSISVHETADSSDDYSDHEYVVISVTDTGTGISDEIRERMFEPFFTTKGKRGNGLGLAIVNQIVTRAGGHIQVRSVLNKGTTVSIYLPRISSTVAQPQLANASH
ncbi:MAG: ATP-binding protein [Steroidobacteraceae bacterium]